MNRKTNKNLIILCLVCAAVFLCNPAWAITLSFNPSTTSVDVGDLIDLDIVISGMESDNLSSFDFNIIYDPAVLTFDSYTLGSELGNIGFFEADDLSWGDLGGGVINLKEFSWLFDFSFQPDAFTLATVSFIGSTPGASLLSFSDVILGDDWGFPLTANLESGSVDVSIPIPEPTTVILLGIGVLGLAGFSKFNFRT